MQIINHLQHRAGMETHGLSLQLILSVPFIIALVIYLYAAIRSKRRKKSWRSYRIVMWITGIFCALAAIIGPLASSSHLDFTAHMLAHLLLGMLAPLLLVLACPMTLILRTLDVKHARSLSHILKSNPIRLISHPITASLLNVGGLWILYTTRLYQTMEHNGLVQIAVHLHVFLAGYLFTGAFIKADLHPHRTSYLYRSCVLIIAMSGHGILSKYIYAHPPLGVPIDQAKTGGLVMYYGGDLIDLILITILCYQWFKETRPRMNEAFNVLNK
ncbi:cytochrome c oxidase assembly protein [Neobacillus sp. SuZ13]|uniref:cytochrome c oxidase assembly protein n=1 Tax=Neobacillus sp. SuZ13 TaxID=3047875 RepID=UPI0024C0BC02|nr:cytochrome c oxidase assembly protein [Neobacillus sp. SuZ13]WHY64901.1 cytochrome c oxidase assembly protein [Neobacillus sp. SuZ13]